MQSPYHVYLLRLWQQSQFGSTARTETTWRFSLEDPHSGERRGFANLEALVAFLESMTLSHHNPAVRSADPVDLEIPAESVQDNE